MSLLGLNGVNDSQEVESFSVEPSQTLISFEHFVMYIALFCTPFCPFSYYGWGKKYLGVEFAALLGTLMKKLDPEGSRINIP